MTVGVIEGVGLAVSGGMVGVVVGAMTVAVLEAVELGVTVGIGEGVPVARGVRDGVAVAVRDVRGVFVGSILTGATTVGDITVVAVSATAGGVAEVLVAVTKSLGVAAD